MHLFQRGQIVYPNFSEVMLEEEECNYDNSRHRSDDYPTSLFINMEMINAAQEDRPLKIETINDHTSRHPNRYGCVSYRAKILGISEDGSIIDDAERNWNCWEYLEGWLSSKPKQCGMDLDKTVTESDMFYLLNNAR